MNKQKTENRRQKSEDRGPKPGLSPAEGTEDRRRADARSQMLDTRRVSRIQYPESSTIIGWAAMLIFAFHACTHMVAAGDTWVAMACGRHFVNHGVDTIEPFSANSHKPGPTPEEIKTWPHWAQWIANKVGLETVRRWHPTGWINQNWLTHVIFYLLVPKSSYADGISFTSNALVYWKFAIYILTVICVYYTGRLLGANPAICAVFACVAMFTGRSFFDIRPAGFSNLLVAVFLLILVLATYRNILYIWLIVPVTVFWCNVHGGYIYVFIMLVPFAGLHLLTSFSKKRFHSIGLKAVCHIVAAGAVTLLAVILFNPFHLTNLTHTFVISVSKHAERWRDVHEWKRAFDWANPVGSAVPFLVLYITACACLAVWILVMIVAPRSVERYRKLRTKSSDAYQWPKVDLSLIAIAALTIYMAIRSRRFIPIAAIAACPVMAMFIDQIIRAISATRNFHVHNRLAVPQMPLYLQRLVAIAGAATVLFFGTWWGLKFKRVYLDPWPSDPKFSSVFMRMTASDAKPFYAVKFIKDNKLQGNMLNYWTEGGFIAWGQEPDPNTGRTPLQLFMDGRAQAAYDRKAFDVWTYIMAGGLLGSVGYDIMQAAQLRAATTGQTIEQVLAPDDYTKIAQCMSQELQDRNVWVVLMPAAVYRDPDQSSSFHAFKALENDPNWRLVFFDDKQKLYVDIRTPRGKELFEGVFNGKTIYPDDYHRNLILAHNWLLYRPQPGEMRKGLDAAISVFNLNPSPTPMLELLTFGNFREVSSEVDKVCKAYFDQFKENHGAWAKEDGYRLRVEAARLASIHLKQVAQRHRNTKLVSLYASTESQYLDQLGRISESGRW